MRGEIKGDRCSRIRIPSRFHWQYVTCVFLNVASVIYNSHQGLTECFTKSSFFYFLLSLYSLQIWFTYVDCLFNVWIYPPMKFKSACSILFVLPLASWTGHHRLSRLFQSCQTHPLALYCWSPCCISCPTAIPACSCWLSFFVVMGVSISASFFTGVLRMSGQKLQHLHLFLKEYINFQFVGCQTELLGCSKRQTHFYNISSCWTIAGLPESINKGRMVIILKCQILKEEITC